MVFSCLQRFQETDKEASERLREALYAVGTPILQSALSTILGVCFMVSVDSYVFRSFLKTVVLVIILGTYHGLVVLPVLLTLLYCNAETEYEDESGSGSPSTRSTEPPPDPLPSTTGSLPGTQHHPQPPVQLPWYQIESTISPYQTLPDMANHAYVGNAQVYAGPDMLSIIR